ncbi:MAG: glucose-1-phosphate cytidylyltransferase [Halobacteriovoraceae bacterium]|nr:glucose-1-phosphate cytidylyltransferase [Halobacteriovoraceae bacterium]
MKAVILAGGLGTRISEETHLKPKPMIEIGQRPILWHIMKTYSHHGINDFIVCCGYKGDVIKEYFANYYLYERDITINLDTNEHNVHNNYAEPWKVTLVDTGHDTMTGGRLKRVKEYLDEKEPFCLTYGDGVSDVNISELVKYHNTHKKLGTITAIRPPERYGVLDFGENNQVKSFKEKPENENFYINGGFFVLSPKVLDYVDGDHISFEREPLTKLANEGELQAYKHDGFWQCMDTLRDKTLLEKLWHDKTAPWKVWP